jgi:hypothetical protein
MFMFVITSSALHYARRENAIRANLMGMPETRATDGGPRESLLRASRAVNFADFAPANSLCSVVSRNKLADAVIAKISHLSILRRKLFVCCLPVPAFPQDVSLLLFG